MSAEINGINVPFVPVGGIESLNRVEPGFRIREFGKRFDEIFREELGRIKFSNHALKRLAERNIQIKDDEIKLLNEAVAKAEEKNSRDVLVLLRDIAFIVSVKNRTVVTVVDSESMREHVFTNIDSAVIL